MAIAPSKLGRFVAQEGFGWPSSHSAPRQDYSASDKGVAHRLREKCLVRPDVTDGEVTATLRAARDEHAAHGYSEYNSPHERVRVFLQPYLTEKGKRWAQPLDSLDLPDDEKIESPPWWKFWP